MTRNYKVSDEQILELIVKGLNNRQIALEYGLVPSGNFNNRCRELRKNNGVPESSGKRGRTAEAKTVEIKSTVLKFEDIRKDERLMNGKKRLIVVAVGSEGFSYRNMEGSIKFMNRKDFEKNAAEYTNVPPGDPQGAPVKTYRIDSEPKLSAGDVKVNSQPIKNLPENVKEKIADNLKEERKPVILNPDFEAAVKEMEAEHEARKEKELEPAKAPEPDT